MLITTIIPTAERLKKVDLTIPWLYAGYFLLIPAPKLGSNTDAVVKPFQWPVSYTYANKIQSSRRSKYLQFYIDLVVTWPKHSNRHVYFEVYRTNL